MLYHDCHSSHGPSFYGMSYSNDASEIQIEVRCTEESDYYSIIYSIFRILVKIFLRTDNRYISLTVVRDTRTISQDTKATWTIDTALRSYDCRFYLLM